MHRKTITKAVACAAAMTVCQLAHAQLSLTGSSYTQNFDGIGTSLPAGWTVRTSATSSTLGSARTYIAAAGSWDGTTGAFKNLAAAALGAGATTTAQNAATDRALGIRQSGAFGDPGAAFTLQIGSTAGRTDFNLSLDAQMLSVQARSTVWTLQYSVGFLPTSFTDLATYSDPGVFGSTNISIPSSALTAIENQSQNVWIRMVALSPSTGSGSRDTFAIDNFNLSWTGDGPVLNPRTLTWNGSSGNWESPNNWLDGAASATFDSTNPDRAVFSNGALPAAVNVGTIVAVGSIAITSTAPVHTFSGSQIVLNGDLTADQSAVFANTVVLSAASTWNVAAGKTITLDAGLAGAALTKTGDGTMLFNAAAPDFTGGGAINGGYARVTAVSGANNVSGLGVGAVTVTGATLEIANVDVGLSTDANGVQIFLGNGATLIGTGTSSYAKGSNALTIVNGTVGSPNTVDLKTLSATDVFTLKNSIRQSADTTTDNFALVRVSGPGRIIFESGGTTSNGGFAGSWQLDSGILQLGPLAPGGFGAPINGLGFKGGDDEATLKPNLITINGGVLALASDINGGASGGATSVRNPITFSGGAIATAELATAEGGKFSGDFTINSGSILLDDPVGTPGVARALSLTTELGIAGNMVWNAASTLNVAGSGSLNINRSSGTATVGAGAQMVIHPGATVNYRGTTDLLSDGVNHVNVVNNSTATFNVLEGTKNIGNLDGAGLTNVGEGNAVVLNANRVRQVQVNVRENSTLNIRAGATPNDPAKTSVVNVLNIAGSPSTPTAKVDLANNSLIIDYATVGTLVDDTRQLLAAGVSSAGTVGLVSSSADATKLLGYADNAVLGLSSFAGQTVDATSLLVKFTYAGDTNLDGQVDITDLGNLATAWQTSGSWIAGDSDYSGFIDITDLGALATNWQAGVGSPLGPSFNDALAAVGGLGGAAVPEPASLSLLALGALAMRRRRHAN